MRRLILIIVIVRVVVVLVVVRSGAEIEAVEDEAIKIRTVALQHFDCSSDGFIRRMPTQYNKHDAIHETLHNGSL